MYYQIVLDLWESIYSLIIIAYIIRCDIYGKLFIYILFMFDIYDNV